MLCIISLLPRSLAVNIELGNITSFSEFVSVSDRLIA